MNYQALIRFENIKSLKLLSLPMSIGMDQNSQILINNKDFEKKNFFLTSRNDVAILLDEHGKIIPITTLKKYGIKVLGIVSNGKNDLFNKIVAIEKQALSEISESAKDFLFYKGTSKYRYAMYGLLASMMIMSSMTFNGSSQITITENLSEKIYNLKTNLADQNIYGNYSRFNKNPGGLKYNLILLPGSNGKALPGRLSFMVSGLDNQGEVELRVNSKTVYLSKIAESCLKGGCTRTIKLPSEILKVGANSINFIHNTPDSIYLVGKTKFTPLEELDGALKTRVNLYFQEASDLFENRNLGMVNLIKATSLITNINNIGKDNFISDEFINKINSLQHRVNESITEFVSDFWFNIDKKVSLGQYDSALTDLEEMTNYFPDASSIEGQKVLQNIKRINNILGR